MEKHAELPGRLRVDAEQGLAGKRQRAIAIVEGHIDRQAVLLISQNIAEKTIHETHGRRSQGLSGAGHVDADRLARLNLLVERVAKPVGRLTNSMPESRNCPVD